MNKGLYLLTFAVGAVAGSAASYFVLKKKFEKITQEEIDSVKEAFTYKQAEEVYSKVDTPAELLKEFAEAVDLEKEYKDIIKSNNYGNDNVVKEKPNSHIRIISPVELGEDEYYSVVGLTYYADGTLADEEGNIVDIDDTISADALNHFGEYDDCAVHVRNIKTETDYEVLLDERDYSEVFK